MSGAALVTGGGGLVAGHLIPALLERGWKVRATARRPRPDRLSPEVDYHQADLAEDDLDELLPGITHVFHLAGATSSLSSDEEMHRSNAIATERLVAAALGAIPARFLFMSSTSIYGEEVELPSPVPEDVDPSPSRGYGKAKLLAEQAVWRAVEKVPMVVVRPVSMFGPGAIKLLASAALDAAIEAYAGAKTFPVHSTPIEQRLVHIGDVVGACLHLIEADGAEGRAFNVCLPVYPSSHELAGVLAEAFGLEVTLEGDPDCGPGLDQRTQVRERMLADGMRPDIVFTKERLRFMRKANRNNRLSVDALLATGFTFGEADLQASIGRTIDWYRTHRWILG
ncbi:MAG: NAD-dependent epimerase/dehydratase family protein [Actinomycetota bacterium]